MDTQKMALVLVLISVIAATYSFTRPKSLSTEPLGPPEWSLSVVELAGMAGCTWEFWMADAQTGKPIPNVNILLEYNDPTLGYGHLNAYTDAKGYATLKTIQYQWVQVTASHPNYEPRTDTFDSRTSNLVVSWTLTPKSSPSNGNYVWITLYAQVDMKWWVVRGTVEVNGESYVFDSQHPYKVVLYLPKETTQTLYVSGYHQTDQQFETKYYSYTVTLTVPAQNSSCWIDILTGELHQGTPPTPPTPPDGWGWGWLDWLAQNWMWIATLAIVLYALPHVASLAKTIKGR